MKQDDRAPFARTLQRARVSAYAPGEFVEQESFMRASEIRALAVQAGIAPGVSVIDLCCGVAGPGRFITQELGCSYLGVDVSSSAIDIARERARDLPCRFEVSRIPPIRPGRFDVVLLLETMLAFRDKETLLHHISRTLTTGGRFAFTMEEGLPLTEAEREKMPDADTVWLTPLEEISTYLERAGLVVRRQEDCSRSHRAVADSLIHAFAADAADIAEQIGHSALEELLTAHRLWSDWLREGRVRKIAFVAEKTAMPPSARPGCHRREPIRQLAVYGSSGKREGLDERGGGRIEQRRARGSGELGARARRDAAGTPRRDRGGPGRALTRRQRSAATGGLVYGVVDVSAGGGRRVLTRSALEAAAHRLAHAR